MGKNGGNQEGGGGGWRGMGVIRSGVVGREGHGGNQEGGGGGVAEPRLISPAHHQFLQE